MTERSWDEAPDIFPGPGKSQDEKVQPASLPQHRIESIIHSTGKATQPLDTSTVPDTQSGPTHVGLDRPLSQTLSNFPLPGEFLQIEEHRTDARPLFDASDAPSVDDIPVFLFPPDINRHSRDTKTEYLLSQGLTLEEIGHISWFFHGLYRSLVKSDPELSRFVENKMG